MTSYELVSTLGAFLAIVVAFVSLVRTRKFNELQAQFTKLSTDLAQRQLTRLVEDELLVGQPRFSVRTVSISGFGDPRSTAFRVKINLRIENSGEPVFEPKCVRLVALEAGTYLINTRASVAPTDRGERSVDVIGAHTLSLTPPANLTSSVLQIIYVDKMGKDKIAEFRVVLEGPPDVLPSSAFFDLHQVSTIVPATPWHFKPDA